MNKLQKGDEVKVIVGKYKGKTSKVTQVLPNLKKVVVEKVNVVKRHMKPSQQSPGGIIEIEKPMDWSKVMLVCTHCKKPSRIQMAIVNGVKRRKCKSCEEFIDKK